MSQLFLTNYSVVVIQHVVKQAETDLVYKLGSQSLIRSQVFFTPNKLQNQFENHLFFVQTEVENSQFKIPIEFENPILLKHKLSNKYLSYSTVIEDEESDSTVKLQLSTQPCYFKFMPCFQYQTKISSKIKFYEDIYLATELSSNKLGYVIIKTPEQNQPIRPMLRLNVKSKLMLHCYSEIDAQESGYFFGQSIWLKHVESKSFLKNLNIPQKECVLFEQLKIQQSQQCIKGLWLIDAIKIDVGGVLHFNEHFYLKNLCANKYLTFSKQPKLVNGEKVYDIKLTQRPSEQSRFVFESLKGEENKIKEGSYLILKHVKSQTFIGTRRSKTKNQQEHSPFLTFTFFQDQDLFTLDKLDPQDQQIYRFIFSFRDELEYISRCLSKQDMTRKTLSQILNLYENIFTHLEKLSKAESFEQVQYQIGPFMNNFFPQLSSLRMFYRTSKQNRELIVKLINKLYEIMKILSLEFKQNQVYFYENIHFFMADIFQDFGAEELISQIFNNNYSLLCKLPNPIPKLNNSNLINTLFQTILSYRMEKGEAYWKKMLKIFSLLDRMIYSNQEVIDINQRLISIQLFQKEMFDKLFFEVATLNRRIKINHPIRKVLMELDQVKEEYLLITVQRIMKLFSQLCEDRNFISKNYIHNYLNKAKQNGVEIIITYLNIPISPNFSNHLYSLITNCYIDSSPRINRKKPLPVILFNLKNQRKPQHEEDLEKSGRLQTALLSKTEYNYRAQPFEISNILNNLQISQPSLKAQELDLYKQQLNQRLGTENWTADLLKSINILIQLESYSISQIQGIKESLYSQIMKKQFSNEIIPHAMRILEQMDIYCQELEIKKITTFLKYCFVQPKRRESIKKKDIAYMLPGSKKIQKVMQSINQNLGNKINEKVMTNMMTAEPEQAHYYREEYNEVVNILKKLSSKDEMKNCLFQMFTNFDKVDFSILKSVFSEIIRINFPKLKMVQLLGKSIVITGDEVSTFQELFELYKKINHLNCISEHWLYSKELTSNEHKHFIDSLVQFTNYMFDDYELNSHKNKNFRKKAKLNINRQLLLKNMAVHEVVLDLLSSNYYILEVKSVKMLEKKQKQTFQECFTFLYYFCQSCLYNLNILSKNIEIIQQYRDLVEVGQTKLLILMYKQNQNLVNQTNHKIVEKTILKIIKSIKGNTPISQCQYNPQFLDFLLTVSFRNGKVIPKNIEYIHSVIQKDSAFTKLLFLTEEGNNFKLSLSIKDYKSQPLCVPILYHKKLFKIFNILIQNLESFGTQMRNRLKQYLNIQDLFRLLSLPDIYSHNGVLPQLYFLLKKELVNLLNLYLDKNDSLNKLYESRNLQKLLDHFLSILIIKPPKVTLKQDNQQIMMPYIEEYLHELRYDAQNQRDYYNQTVHPLLSKLYFLFEKIPNRENNTNFKKIKQILESVVVSELSQNHLLKNINYGIDLVDLKWRNFVDADADNSEQQKFTKRAILELLMHEQTYKQIKKEQEAFYEELSQREEKYFNTMQKFIEMASQQEQQESTQSQQLFYEIIKQLAEYLQWVNTKDREFKGLEPKEVVETLISYVSRPSFDYNKQILRETYYHILRIFLIFLEKDQEDELPVVFYDYFKSENSNYRFFQCLNSAVNEIFRRIEGEKIHEQINYALGQLSMCGQKKNIEIDKKALKFIKLLCKHIPFTEFFRNQPFPTISIDFLEKLFNILYIMLKRNEKETFIITISNVDIVQEILDCMQWMLNGCNEVNQNYLIDTKFPSMVVEMLKKEVINPYENKAQESKRDMLLEQVVSFYESNGINIKDTLLKNIKYLDFKHIYLLNRLKLAMLKLLHQCTLANERGMYKIKIIVPVQLLKINLIWTYSDFLQQKLEYSQENILKSKEQWKLVVEKQKIEGTFLMVGFYFYILIEQYKNQDKDSKEDDQAQNIQDEEKQKEKIVKRFFSAIVEREKKNQKMKSLQKEPFGKEMVQFYKSYYTAHNFYRSKTLSIEAKVYEKLIKIYFPLLPICERLTDKMKQKLIDEAERISHQEKIKSLMQFEQQSYELIDGQELFFQNMQQKSEALYHITRVVQNQDNFFLAIWVVSCLIVLNYLIYDYMDPQAQFSYLMGKFITPQDFLSAFMLILQIISALCGLILLVNLVLKKIPFLVTIHRKKYEREKEQKDKDGKAQEGIQSSFGFYILQNLLTTLFFDIYIIAFSFLTIIHPVFSGFELVYIVSRIEIGQLIIQAIKETAFSLFAATGLLVIFNYVYSVIIYIAFTHDIGYGGTCQNLFKCLLMVFDQSLKGDSGFLGYADRDDTYNVINIKILSEIFYILFVKKVIFEIFSGTIIDKFSQLREKSENTQEDEDSNCYICGQERFQIDFELQGFQDHVEVNHNKFNYVYYVFYLRRKNKIDYGIEENYIWNLRKKQKTEWIPDGTSLLKEQKNKQNAEQQERNFEQQYEQFFQKKMQELKKIKQKMQSLSTQLNDDTLIL